MKALSIPVIGCICLVLAGCSSDWLNARDRAIEAMCHPEVSPFARFGPEASGLRGGNDHAFLRDPIPRRVQVPTVFAQPTGWSGPGRLWSAVVELATQLGYAGCSERIQ